MSWEPSFTLGPGSAELTEGRRFLRIIQRHARYILGGGAVAIVAIVFIGRGDGSTQVPIGSSRSMITETVSPTPLEVSTGSGYAPEQVGETYDPTLGTSMNDDPASPARRERLQIYAISLAELPGLALDASPGASLDLWVTWEPPLTRRPKVQLLVEGVTLEKVTPPVTVDGPYVANLLVPVKEMPQLLYGDRFGKLNASIRGE